MTQKENLIEPVETASLSKRVLAGGGIALTLITVFLVGVNNPDPAWGKYWMVRPLIITPLAGAAGGACFYFIHRIFDQQRWSRLAAFGLGILVYVIGLWLGFVLGLDGTLWD